MVKGKDIPAETLDTVLEAVRTSGQTGLLRIECVYEGRAQEGEVSVQGGQVVDVHTGPLTGQQALARLLQWRQISFAFFPATGQNAASAAPSPLRTLSTQRFQPARSTGSPRASGTGGLENQAYQPVPLAEGKRPGLERIIPRKVGGEHDVMALPLTRPQRAVYLLIDGRRTVTDLSRCLSKRMQEIERLLSELQTFGLIGF
jgi:Domain of unknown function (DUF4388)